MKRKVSLKKILLFALIIIVICVISLFLIYLRGISHVGKDNTNIIFEVNENSTFYSISDELYKENLIRSELFYKIYLKLNKPTGLKKGVYSLNKTMSVKEIVGVLSGDPDYNYGSVSVTFKEGINMRKVASIIADNTDNTESDVFNLLNDELYLDELINSYWFITDEVKNNNIYYSLEGYLFPDTYQLKKNMNVKDIFKIMLDNLDVKLKPYKKEIENSDYSFHELLTLASIVELEASNSNDRAGVARVFYNRLDNNWTLGSDVTTYYGIKVDMNERDLYKKEIEEKNAYNTRSSSMSGKLPVGPVGNPGIESIKAVIEPEDNDYFYFVADKTGKTYFTKSYKEHTNTVASLKEKGLWYTY